MKTESKVMENKVTKRVPEIELIKAIAIIGMVMVHVLEGSLEYFENAWEFPGKGPYCFIEFIGGIPAAGAFTFAMGWGAAFSDRSTVKIYLKRALKIGLLLFYVNFVYAILPGILDPDHFTPFRDHPWSVIGFNIYSFAALWMLFFALMKKLADRPRLRVGICLMIIAAIFIADIIIDPESYSSGSQWTDTLIGIFVRENHYSWFPLVPWGIFPPLGYLAGMLYRRWNNRAMFAMLCLLIGTAAFPTAYMMLYVKGLPRSAANPGWYEAIDYYALSPLDVICAVGILALEIALAFTIMTLAKGRLHPLLAFMSRNVMQMFVVHWLFVSPLFLYLIHVTDVWMNAWIGVGALIVTCLTVKFWEWIKTARR